MNGKKPIVLTDQCLEGIRSIADYGDYYLEMLSKLFVYIFTNAMEFDDDISPAEILSHLSVIKLIDSDIRKIMGVQEKSPDEFSLSGLRYER